MPLCAISSNFHNVLVFPLSGEPTCYTFSSVLLGYWQRAQEWVTDLRARTGTWADTGARRLHGFSKEFQTIG